MAECSTPERYLNGERDQVEREEKFDMYTEDYRGHQPVDYRIIKGPPLEYLTGICPYPPSIPSMDEIQIKTCLFLIKPFRYSPNQHGKYPQAIRNEHKYIDIWDEHHVRMPCSPRNVDKNGRERWPNIVVALSNLKKKCEQKSANFDDLKKTIELCADRTYNVACLEYLFKEIFSDEQRLHFISVVLPSICSLAMKVDIICSQPPPLLRAGSNESITMSQVQAASLLACSFFCLFPCRSGSRLKKEYKYFQDPNFNALYLRGGREKVEKIRCIVHYFERIQVRKPTGVITFRRYSIPSQYVPKWSESNKNLIPVHFTTAKKIEDIECSLQVDFANRYIGGGVLNTGCVQEEIRFAICPEMIVSILVCEAMDDDECIFLIGCERYSSYRGYSKTFQYDTDYQDRSFKDNWGRKWSHVVAIDAIYFDDPLKQFDMKIIKREILKAYTGFYSRKPTNQVAFPVVTGNWGCGAFNGDREVKAIIQLMAASQTVRPMIYTAFGDKKLIESFAAIYDYLIGERATVRDLYRYLKKFCEASEKTTLFEFI
ncbi:unnamed protein product, partial [Adineta ricciae]